MSQREDLQAEFSLILASSVHDMKNSLGMLINTLDDTMREMPPKTPAQASRYATLQYEVSRINGELIQLLGLYRTNLQSMPVHVEEHYVRDLIDEQLARNDLLLTSRHIDVELRCDEDLLWYFDAELIGGVIHNVLVNCARYTRSKLLVSAVIEEKTLVIQIADDGGGYPQVMIDQPVNAQRGISFETGSTNLGLFFAQRVASLHRSGGKEGFISLANGGELDGGIFTLTLP
ncbi:sensor histidine kinase [Simiduia agarivorans]|uniref:histidine kinase n=1 Tax=Simiduia agarivorans (strain DSM 21679 / JCM 13881 / BCRC 17597 / SA1) TaxID=1117647 RepID=K4KIH6_SIMAS|nr:HAMP domain-containing sensor histidine kinase [Simiduia agarivorans]AFU98005.1 sensor histidine kinase [Simiduia agarivorans SA1 = DSM 21679]